MLIQMIQTTTGFSFGGDDDFGDLIAEFVGTVGGDDASRSDFCGPCCTDANNKHVTEHLEVDGVEKTSAYPSFDGQQLTL